jgi:ATP-dependent HslUV protease subunit HslV
MQSRLIRSFPTLAHGFRTTTILAVRKDGQVALMGDKKVTTGNVSAKETARKLRVIQKKDQPDVLVGFAGSVADALTLVARLEGKLDEYPGQLLRACVELAKAWRSDKYLRRLEASIIVADADGVYQVDGSGNVLEAEEGVACAGSGGYFALAAAKALYDIPGMTAEQICRKAIMIGSAMDTHSNTAHDIFISEKKK